MEPVRARLIVNIFEQNGVRYCELRVVEIDTGRVIERIVQEMEREVNEN